MLEGVMGMMEDERRWVRPRDLQVAKRGEGRCKGERRRVRR